MTATDFISIDELTIDWGSLVGIVAIVGPNGSGKSTLFEAVYWGLTGKTIRDIPAESVIRRGKTKAVVRLTLQNDAGEQVTIERTRVRGKSSDLTVSTLDADDSTLSARQKMLEQQLRLDARHLLTTTVLSGDTSSFCRLRDSERSAVLERMLGITHFLDAGELAKEKVRVSRNLLERERATIDAYTKQLVDIRDDIKTYEKRSREWEEEKSKVETELVSKLQRLSADRDNEHHRCSKAKKRYDEAYASYRQQVESIRSKSRELTQELSKLQTTANETRANIRSTESEIEDLEEVVEQNRSANTERCPTCNQRWPKDKPHPHRLVSLESTQVKLKGLRQELAKLRKKLTTAEARREEVAEEQAQLTLPSPPSDKDYRKQERAYQNAEREVVRVQERIDTFRSQLNPHDAYVYELRDKRKKARQTVKRAEKKVSKIRNDIAEYEYWVHAFHRKGIPNWLIGAAIPQLNASARKYIDVLTEHRARVSFDPSFQKGQQTSFAIDVDFDRGAKAFSAASKGERTCVDLSVLLAVSDLAAVRSPMASFDQRFLDEVFDGLDEDHQSRVVTMLRKTMNLRSAFVITHDESLKANADSTISVHSVRGITRITVESPE